MCKLSFLTVLLITSSVFAGDLSKSEQAKVDSLAAKVAKVDADALLARIKVREDELKDLDVLIKSVASHDFDAAVALKESRDSVVEEIKTLKAEQKPGKVSVAESYKKMQGVWVDKNGMNLTVTKDAVLLGNGKNVDKCKVESVKGTIKITAKTWDAELKQIDENTVEVRQTRWEGHALWTLQFARETLGETSK